MAVRGYHSYHGRRRAGRVALVVLLVLVLLAAAAFLILQDRIIYQSDGSITIDLPFFRGDGQTASDPEGGGGENLPVEILPEEDGQGTDGQSEAEPLRAGVISVEELCAGGAGSLEQAGCNAFLTEVKGFNGTYYYISQQASRQALADGAVTQSALTEAVEGTDGLWAIARVGCFHDSFHAFADMTGAGICQSGGYIWYDNLSSHWMDPAKDGTRAYMAAVLDECADMGFDEVVLTDFGYPTLGNLQNIDYSGLTVTKTEALCGFLEEMRRQAGDRLVISLELSESQVLQGTDQVSGLDLEAFLPLVDRLYISDVTQEQQVWAAVEAAGGQDADLVLSMAGGEENPVFVQ